MTRATTPGETTPAAPDATPLAEAKLAAPALGPGVVRRPRLDEALDADARLVLIVAPAGYGKTTAARAWSQHRGAPVAWVTLDEGDNDPARLWAYVATALDRVREGLGRGALQRLRVPGTSIEAVVDELMNGIASFGQELVVVLDELETVTDRECLGSLEHAIDRLPANARLALVARSDPPFQTGRLRVRRALVELRAPELAFDVREVRELLHLRSELRLEDAELEMLRSRTEGWPAALELAALWLREVEDPGLSVRQFTGDHRFVADFLSDEVLDALDGEVRAFLLQASVLGRLTSALCDEVLDRSDSAAMLSLLERSNLFVTRLEHGGWYRVHPLFAEYASFRLAEDEPGAAASIHRRAAGWFAARGLPVDAVDHAALAGDLDLAASLLAEHHLAIMRRGGSGTLLRWAMSLPQEQLLDYPDLAAAAATAAAIVGGRAVERRRLLALVDRSEAERPDRCSAYARATAAMVRAASLDGRLENAVESGRRAVELCDSEVDEVLVAALGGYARALYFAGDLDGAWNAAMRAVEHPDAERRAPGHAFARATLAFVAADRGRLSSARLHAERARAIVGGVGTSRSWLGANAAAALGAAHALEGRLADAERELAAAERLFHEELATVHHAWALLLLARLRVRRGKLEAAEASLSAAREEVGELVDSAPVDLLMVQVADELARARARAASGELRDPPSRAELAVLELLASDLSARQIGEALFVSPNTVRSHTGAIYRKLGVKTRADAVARADALGLLRDAESPG